MRQNIARSRFDAISDGVFAIAMTIMVLEIKTPKLGDSSADAIEHYLKTTLPTLVTFAVSFILLAAMWVSHSSLPSGREHVSRKVAMANFHVLFFICIVPFSTALLNDVNFHIISVLVFEGALIAAMLLLSRLRYQMLVHEQVPEEYLRTQRRQVALWAGIVFVGVLVSLVGVFWNPAVYSGYAIVSLSAIVFRSGRGNKLGDVPGPPGRHA